jgi:hypothetical protein
VSIKKGNGKTFTDDFWHKIIVIRVAMPKMVLSEIVPIQNIENGKTLKN